MKSLLLAEKVKDLRLERAWSQAQLSEISSLSIRTIQRIEFDGRCSHESLLALASSFEVDVSVFTSLVKESLEKYSLYLFGFKFSAGWLKPTSTAIISFILIFPALYFLISAILKYLFNFSYFFDSLLVFYSSKEILFWFNIISPAVFLIGLILSIVINLLVILTLKIWKDNRTIHTDISLNPRVANLIITGISFLCLVILLAYAVGENFALR